MFLTVVLFLIVASQIHGHTYHLGDCPTVKPMEDFNINKGKILIAIQSGGTISYHNLARFCGSSHILMCEGCECYDNSANCQRTPSLHAQYSNEEVKLKNIYPQNLKRICRDSGKWYVIQKTATGSSCLINIYTEDENNPGHFKIEQISEHLLLGLTSVDHKYHYTGDLVIPNPANAADMKVRFPLNVAGGASYTVFATDYNTYAGIFTCQKLAFAHRRSATIISRTKTLDKEYIDKIREKLSSFGIDPYDLSIIKQGNCTEPTEETTTINIDEKTFTAESVANVFRKAGEKIGDGIETVADSAKKVYTKYRGDHDESKEEINVKRNMKDDAEWLP